MSIDMSAYTNQTIIIIGSDGSRNPISLSDIDNNTRNNVGWAINFGVQLGACITMLITLLVLTRPDKRRTSAFALYGFTLLMGVFRNFFMAIYSVSPWVDTYAFFSGDLSAIPPYAYRLSIAGSVFPALMTISLQASLFLGARTVGKELRPLLRKLNYVVSALFAGAAIATRICEMVIFCLYTRPSVTIEQLVAELHYQKASLGAFVGSVAYFSLLFGFFMLKTIRTRRHELKKASPVAFVRLCVMSFMTVVIPAVFAFIEIGPEYFPGCSSISMTACALLLPLSALWAAQTTSSVMTNLNIRHCGDGVSSDSHGKFNSFSSNISEMSDRKGSIPYVSPSTVVSTVVGRTLGRNSLDDELERMDRLAGIHVNKTVSIHSTAESMC